MSYSIIIPSTEISNLAPCISAIRTREVKARIIVIWDQPNESGALTAEQIAARFDPRVEVIPGEKPFIFARAVNAGIEAADFDDVVLLNDDAILVSRGGFDLLAKSAQHPEYGAVSALIEGMAAAPDQCFTDEKYLEGGRHPGAALLRVRHHMIAFMAVAMRREILDLVGLLDEQFVGYGYEDDDMCKRLKLSGFELGVECSCLVDHGSLPSTYRGLKRPGSIDMLAENRGIFDRKWKGLKP